MTENKRTKERRNTQLKRVLQLIREMHSRRSATVNELEADADLRCHARTIRRDLDSLIAAGFLTRIDAPGELGNRYVWSLDTDILSPPKVDLSDETIARLKRTLLGGADVSRPAESNYDAGIPSPNRDA